METNAKSAGNRKLMIAAIAALLLVNGVTAYFMFNNLHHKNVLIVQKAAVEKQYTSLEDEYQKTTNLLDQASAEIGDLKGKNSDLDRMIQQKQQMIAEIKHKLSSAYAKNTLTGKNLEDARAMISQYEATIASLQQKVESYRVQTVSLSSDLDCQMQQNDALTQHNGQLSQKIETASILDLSKLEVEAVKHKMINGKEVDVKKAKAAESLKISFETGANKALDPGKLDLYVRIINPRGETISLSKNGSAFIPETAEGKPVPYTKQASIPWNQKNKKVVVYWNRYINDPGTYRVEVYQSGQVIGKGSVSLS